MPTRVLLEGPAIEPLLAQVRQEYGVSARIISADKVRTGGLGGFFAKQRYELSVEVPDEPPAAELRTAEPSAAEAPATLEQLLERAGAHDRFAPAPPAEQEQAAEQQQAAPAPLPPRASLLSTTTNAFAEVMAGLGIQPSAIPAAAVAAGAVTATPTRPGSPAVRPYHPPTVDATPVNAVPTAAPHDLRHPAAAMLPPLVDLPPAGNPVGFAPPSAAPNRVPAPGGPSPVSAPPAVSTPAPPAMFAPAAPTAPTAPAVAPQAPATPAEPLAAKLTALGLPAPLAARVTGTDAYGAVLQALTDLPAVPEAPDRAGDVLVIAGELAHALPIARRVLDELRLDASRLLLAGPSAAGTGIHPSRKISGPAEAERKARKLHRADTPYVVVLDAPVTGTNGQWARDTCDAIGATAVWVAVDATRKTADTAAYLKTLGEIEAVAVYGAAQTADPASVLALDLPVVAVDGQAADRHTWAALLCQRLTDAETAAAGGNRRRRRGR